MNALIIFLVAMVILVIGYVCYGGWLAKQWGVDPKRPTPAHELEDGVDYVPAPPYVVLGHHFSSIAGAGPINGPIQAAVFGWVPVLLWVLVGGIFFGAMHDFGALFASLRHKGQTLAVVVAENIDNTAKKLFCIFAYLTLLLVVAAFASIVANTFAVSASAAPATNLANEQTAMISVIFIGVAVVYGFVTRGRNIPGPVNIVSAIILIVIMVAIGYNLPLMGIAISLDYDTWMIILGVYILVASVAPVWILLQPRDYLSSYLLYGMIILAVIGIVGASIMGAATDLQIPAFTGFVASNAAFDASTGQQLVDEAGKTITNKAAASGFLFPALFITIACGAISGFHSLVASGTTSKQLDKETDAKPIAYGGMLLECVLAVLTLCAIGYAYKWNAVHPDQALKGATAIFGGGIAHMIDDIIPGSYSILNSLLVLTYSAFCLTSLDTATRLARFMFQEFWLEPGQTPKDIKEGWKKVMVNPYFATILTVVLGILLGMTGYAKIWGLFGAANQLLAGIGLLAVATWLGNAGKNNRMFLIPMAFMIVVTIASLAITVKNQIGMIAAGGADWGPYAQTILGILLIVLAVVLVIEGVQTLKNQKGKKVNA